MITEDYVSFETAKLLKKKGFNCDSYYHYKLDDSTLHHFNTLCNTNIEGNNFITAPTLQMAMKWLREVHNLDIIVPPQFDNTKWTYSAIIFKLLIPCTEIKLNDNKDKKEAACKAAIKYCLENLI